MSATKQKGTKAETDIVNYLNSEGIIAFRNPPQGSKDKGDINLPNLPVIIEVKNQRAMKLAEWIDEAVTERDNAQKNIGIVFHKRPRKGSPSAWYCTMTGEDMVKILKFMQQHQ
jgi:hypothetical protein